MTHPILTRLIQAIEDKDLEAFSRLYAESAVMHEPLLEQPARGRDEITRGEASLMHAFSDLEVRVRNVSANASLMVAEVLMTAVNDGPLDLGDSELTPTGRRIEVPMVWVFDLDPESGQILEERDYFDTALIFRQLGLESQTGC